MVIVFLHISRSEIQKWLMYGAKMSAQVYIFGAQEPKEVP